MFVLLVGLSRKVSGDVIGAVGLDTHLTNVISFRIEVCSELGIFLIDGVLTDMGKKEQSNGCGEHTQRSGDEDGVLTSLDGIGVGVLVVEDSEDLGADVGTDLASGSSDTIIFAANSGCTGLGCDEANVVTWPEFAECKEETITI